MSGNSTAAGMLKDGVERIEALKAERALINAQISSIKKELKGQGFDAKAVARIMVLREMSAEDREEHLALCEIYGAALGMLNGTPLGEAARRRMERRQRPDGDDEAPEPDGEDGEDDGDDDDGPGGEAQPDFEPATPPKRDLTDEDVQAARDAGREAAREGRKVTENPYTARDPRRAAWDEGWCAEAGSDGMEIPPAWQRKKPKKPKKGGEGEGGEGQ